MLEHFLRGSNPVYGRKPAEYVQKVWREKKKSTRNKKTYPIASIYTNFALPFTFTLFFFTLGITATVSPARTRKTKQQEVVQFHRHLPFSSFLVFFHRPYFFCVWQTLGGAIAAYRMTPVTKDDPCPSVSTYFTWLLSLFIVLLGTPEYLRLREATFPFKAAT